MCDGPGAHRGGPSDWPVAHPTYWRFSPPTLHFAGDNRLFGSLTPPLPQKLLERRKAHLLLPVPWPPRAPHRPGFSWRGINTAGTAAVPPGPLHKGQPLPYSLGAFYRPSAPLHYSLAPPTHPPPAKGETIASPSIEVKALSHCETSAPPVQEPESSRLQPIAPHTHLDVIWWYFVF